MDSRRLAAALLCAMLAPGLGACSTGGTIGDVLPEWAGGLPKDAPPRPGTPEYEEFRKRLEEPQPKSAEEADGGQAAGRAAKPAR